MDGFLAFLHDYSVPKRYRNIMDAIHVNIPYNLTTNLLSRSNMLSLNKNSGGRMELSNEQKAEELLLSSFRFKSKNKQDDITQHEYYEMVGTTMKVINEKQKLQVFDMDDKNINRKHSICDYDCWVNENKEECNMDPSIGKISQNKKEADFKKEAFQDGMKAKIAT